MSEQPVPAAVGSSAELGPLPEPRMWYDHATQKCHGMAPTGGTNERLWDSSDMHAYAAAAVAADRERCALARQVLDRLMLCYRARPVDVAEACDTLIDRSGGLLGWIRDAARRA